MAENKKSFILYADQTGLFGKLTDAKAGKLIKLIFDYVNDKDPVPDDLLLQVAFEPIKLQLKRDLKDWEETKKERSKSGRLGNLKRWHKDLYDKVESNELSIIDAENIAKNRTAINSIANIAVTDNVTVNDTVTVTEESKGKNLRTPDLSKSNLYRQPAIPDWKDVHRLFLSNGGTEEMAKSFFEKNNAVGWFLKGSPITNFSNLVPSFIQTWNEIKNKNGTNRTSNPKLKGGKSAGAYALAEELHNDLTNFGAQ